MFPDTINISSKHNVDSLRAGSRPNADHRADPTFSLTKTTKTKIWFMASTVSKKREGRQSSY